MRAVADELGVTTSTVSQQIAALAAEAGTRAPRARRPAVRLTPAGRRLAEHAVTILAAVDAARLDLDPDAEPPAPCASPASPPRSAARCCPSSPGLATTHPACTSQIAEHEPFEALALLAARRASTSR